MASFAQYGSVVWWREPKRGGVSARFRGRWADCEVWFPTLSAFRKAARPQFRRGMASETTAERHATWLLLNGN